ncbi:MAG: 3-phosphoshikimate 1-carboxyvinyltransferase [archaeon]
MISEQIRITGGTQLRGAVPAVPSKSHTHRAVLAASLSSERSRIENPSLSEDVQATVEAAKAYGAEIILDRETLVVTGADQIGTPQDVVDCRDSGSTMRFVTPILAHAQGISVVTGGRSLRKRPMQPMIDSLSQLGVQCYSSRNNGCAPLILFGGTYRGGKTQVVGDVSSQFISGLLFSAACADQTTSIEVTTHLESEPYVHMTVKTLTCHGIEIDANSSLTRFTVKGGQIASAYDHMIEGDYSSAALILAAGVVTGSEIGVSGLKTSGSLQGDSEVISFLKDMGADVEAQDRTVRVRSARLRATTIDARNHPDLVPPLTAVACCAQGTTNIVNAERLKIKESDRLATLASELTKMGAEIIETDEGLEITGVSTLRGATVDSHEDHRIAMACAVVALAAKGETTINGAGCVAKSYPTFFDDLRRLGANIIAQQ